MPRVTSPEVRAIVALDDAVVLDPFILVASILVETYLLDVGHPEPLLKEIERWLSAHFACIPDARYIEVTTGPDRLKFESAPMTKGLGSTRYGQQAIALDASGTLDMMSGGGTDGGSVGFSRAIFEVL